MIADRIAAAPISWGVSEAPDWGFQMDPATVLSEIRELGFGRIEQGPVGYLGSDAGSIGRTLDRHGLRLVAGFVPVLLHAAARADLTSAEAAILTLAECGAEVVVLAARSPEGGYDSKLVLTDGEWRNMASNLRRLEAFIRDQGLTPTVHPHVGTGIEDRDAVMRLLETTATSLCLDTGHLSIGGTNPGDLVSLAPGRIAHVHLKDVDLRIAGEVRAGRIGYAAAVRAGLYRPLGDGDLDMAGIVRKLSDGGYRGWYVLEQDVALDGKPKPGSGPKLDVARSLRFMESLRDSVSPS